MVEALCLVTPYPPGRFHLGGGGWVDRRLHASLVEAGVDVSVVSVTGPSGAWEEGDIRGWSAGDVPLEVRGDRRALARVAAAMAVSTKPYLACKFTAFPGWSEAADLLRKRTAGRPVVTSGWPPLLLAASAGVPVALHVAHNVDSVIASRHAPRPLRLLGEVSRLRRLERSLLHVPAAVTTLSRSDGRRLAAWGIHSDPLPLPLMPVANRASDVRSVGFIGKAGWPPNAEALEVLLGPVHEALTGLGSDVTFVLGGAGTEVHRDHPRVTRAGWVADLDDFYRGVGLIVVPRLGASTGVSIKVLEAVEHGVPAVVPESLASAIDPDGPWILAEDAPSTARSIAAWADGSTPAPEVAEWAALHPPSRTAAHLIERLTNVGDARS